MLACQSEVMPHGTQVFIIAQSLKTLQQNSIINILSVQVKCEDQM